MFTMNATTTSPLMSNVERIGAWIPLSIRSIDAKNGTTIAVLTILVVALVTRISSGTKATKSGSGEEPTDPIFMPPYWLPGIGHLLNMVFHSDQLFTDMRDFSGHGIFALNLGGATHNMVHSPSLVQGIYSKRSDFFAHEDILKHVTINVFGIPKWSWKKFAPMIPALNAPLLNHLFREPSLSTLSNITVKNLEDNTANLVSFMPSLIDQSEWERSSGATMSKTKDGRPAEEVSLMPLLRDFIGMQALPAVFGTDLHGNSSRLFEDLWSFDDSFLILMAGLPRWMPIPKLAKAHAARARLHALLVKMHAALEDDAAGRSVSSEWANIDNVSDCLKARQAVYREHSLPLQVRAASDFAILWATMANSNFVAFWLMLRILATPELVEAVRKEIAPFVKVRNPSEGAFGMQEAPRLEIDHKSLTTSCPLLKSCYIESLRLDSAPWSVKKVAKSFTLSEKQDDFVGAHAGQRPHTYRFEAGTYADVPIGIHLTDPRYFPRPETFVPDRHIKRGDDGSESADWGSVRPYGGGKTICKGRLFAEREIMACTAALFTLWEFEPVDEKGWVVPGHVRSAGVAKPDKDIRVRISRRRC